MGPGPSLVTTEGSRCPSKQIPGNSVSEKTSSRQLGEKRHPTLNLGLPGSHLTELLDSHAKVNPTPLEGMGKGDPAFLGTLHHPPLLIEAPGSYSFAVAKKECRRT